MSTYSRCRCDGLTGVHFNWWGSQMRRRCGLRILSWEGSLSLSANQEKHSYHPAHRSKSCICKWPAGGGTPAPAAMTACPSSCWASQDGAGLLDKFIMSPPACCRDAAAPADYSIEDGWCHHRVLERSQECPLRSKGPECPQQMESALTLYVAAVWSSPVYCSVKACLNCAGFHWLPVNKGLVNRREMQQVVNTSFQGREGGWVVCLLAVGIK